MSTKKNPAAVALGRKGGKKTAASLTPEQRQAAARLAAEARWAKTAEDRAKAAAASAKVRSKKAEEK
ncbi:MAG: hypothetical protein WAN65_19225 [Candidatus Sulfotelmatobacter sp.]